ncbi:GntR family transcriptional regulator [Parafrigoribacterium soli]|uniref:GntR family transcriptional regulator n=1 Tax=Parafrigoribacterium soli TaxID=3144663 RepID=UPI0032EFCB5D
MITIETADPTPPYEQIRAQIATLIRSGQLPAGHRLPSVRQLAADLRAAPGTIARAYRSLEAAGLVESSRAKGTRVRSGKAVSDQVTRTIATLVDALVDEDVELEDVVAAISTEWRRAHPDEPMEPTAMSASEHADAPELSAIQ